MAPTHSGFEYYSTNDRAETSGGVADLDQNQIHSQWSKMFGWKNKQTFRRRACQKAIQDRSTIRVPVELSSSYSEIRFRKYHDQRYIYVKFQINPKTLVKYI